MNRSLNANVYITIYAFKVNILGENVIFETASKLENLFIYVNDAKYEKKISREDTFKNIGFLIGPKKMGVFFRASVPVVTRRVVTFPEK